MKKMLFVVNPFAGQKKANRYMVDMLSVFNRAGYDVLTYVTAAPADAVQVVKNRAAEMDVVVCAGGDGTFNETLTGIMECGEKIPIGYIPCGSTNDLAASLKLSTNPVEAAREIVEGSPVYYDIGKFGQRYFSYVASFGVFTKTAYSTPQSIKNALGHAAYILEGIQELSQIRAEHVRIETDAGVIEDDFLFGAISNSTSVGGILTLDPKQVDMTDGKFELLLVRAPRDIMEVRECLMALQSKKYNCAMITFVSTEKLEITANPQMGWTLDGEREAGHRKVTVENLQHAIGLMKRG